ncbi:site-specific integrase [Salicibibacter cibarius]|uniref:Site-specific integrase n=1 Tax=Salicibibacter cibarius TaxID=2743000 RepID=A0A7T7CBE3_9BACI|nr:site-specific integrase [Salicibibacter cibarius]QQK75842.1 site-specific integrase [Salicibibacter cibarius]
MRLKQPNEVLKRTIRKLDMHPITIHGMRHTHASLLFEAGVDIKDVQERLGHSDIKMTLDIYTHVTETKQEKSAQTFANYMQDETLGDKLVTLGKFKDGNS